MVLVANLATNFEILITSMEDLGTLATVSDAMSCPVNNNNNLTKTMSSH